MFNYKADESRKTGRRKLRWEDGVLQDIRILNITYLRSWALLEELSIVQPLKNLPSILWNPKVQHRAHKSPPLVPILNHTNPIHSISSYLSKIHFNIVHPPTSWSSQWSLSVCMPTNILYAFLVSSIRATCPAHLILLDLIILIILGEEYNLWTWFWTLRS
jgi:hypothetical protein